MGKTAWVVRPGFFVFLGDVALEDIDDLRKVLRRVVLRIHTQIRGFGGFWYFVRKIYDFIKGHGSCRLSRKLQLARTSTTQKESDLAPLDN